MRSENIHDAMKQDRGMMENVKMKWRRKKAQTAIGQQSTGTINLMLKGPRSEKQRWKKMRDEEEWRRESAHSSSHFIGQETENRKSGKIASWDVISGSLNP